MKEFTQEIQDALGGEYRAGSSPVDKLQEGDKSMGNLNSVGQSLFRLMVETNKRLNEYVQRLAPETTGGALIMLSGSLEEMRKVTQLQVEAQIASCLLNHHLCVHFGPKVKTSAVFSVKEGWQVVSHQL